jgi:hypothetical protein
MLCVVRAKCTSSHPAYEAKENCSECNHEKQPQLPCAANQDIRINQKTAGKILKHVRGPLFKSPAMATEGEMGQNKPLSTGFA